MALHQILQNLQQVYIHNTDPIHLERQYRQFFVNQDGWLIAAPYEYSGETLEKEGYEEEQLLGEYELVVHNPKAYYQKTGTKQIGIIKTQNITLNQDKTVSGDVTGTWSYTENTSEMTITINVITVTVSFPDETNSLRSIRRLFCSSCSVLCF